MPNLQDIRARIASIGKTRKVVSAMKMVSAAKLARSTQAIQSARPYAERMQQVLASVTGGVEADAHPLLVPREAVRRLDLVVFTSDRGLCGPYNANVSRYAARLIGERREAGVEQVSLVPVGRKGGEFLHKRRLGEIVRGFTGLSTVRPAHASEIAEFLMARYLAGESDEVVLVYANFASALTQRPAHTALLPVVPDVETPGSEPATAVAYEVEPSPEALLALLVPRAVEFAVFRALLENQAGEHGARMTAMDSATNNTTELIHSLTLEYNKARQAAITAELVEIVSGAEAL